MALPLTGATQRPPARGQRLSALERCLALFTEVRAGASTSARFSRTTMVAIASHAKARIEFRTKNCRGAIARTWIARKVVNAARASPTRTKNVSIAAFPLYFISLVVGNQRT